MRIVLAGVVLVGLVGVVHAGDSLDRASISAGMAKVKARVEACASQATTGGTVKVAVTVAPDGSVTTVVTSTAKNDGALATCVSDVVKTATFPRSTHGGSFSYPFVFATPPGVSVTPPPSPPPPPSAAPPATPDYVDRAAITTGMSSIKARVEQCGAKLQTATKLKVRVTVAPAGHVTSVEPDGDKVVGKCVADAIMSVNFGATASGGTFVYPFVFGSPASPAPSANGSPDTQGPAAVEEGIDSVRAELQTCSDTHKAKGTVQLELTIDSAAQVTEAKVTGTNVRALTACLVKAAKAAKIRGPRSGGTFIVPLTFGKSVTAGEPVQMQENLDRASIVATLSSFDHKLASCRAKHAGLTANVMLELQVDGAGRVTSVAHVSGDKKPLACLVAAVKTVKFGRSVSGSRFTYPFAFGDALLAEALDRTAIADGVAKVKGAITACATATAKGTVKVRVTVAPSGAVTNAEIDRTPDANLGACVAAAMAKATFKPTKSGGSFSYPFVF